MGTFTRIALGVGTGGVSESVRWAQKKAREEKDQGSKKDGITGLYNDLTGKTAADEEKARIRKAHNLQKGVTKEGLAANNAAVDSAQGDIRAGTDRAGQYLGAGYDQARQDVGASPNRMADLYGGGLRSGFETDPGYQFRLQQGQGAAAAAGGDYDAATLAALNDYNQGAATNEYGNYAQRQMGMAGAADRADMARNMYLGDAAIQQGQGQAGLYSGMGGQLAGLGMQGAGLNTGIRQTEINALSPAPQQPQGPSTTQQALALAAMYAGSQAAGRGY